MAASRTFSYDNSGFIVSIVSFWEINFKTMLGKPAFVKDMAQIFSVVNEYEFTVLLLAQPHIVFLTNLPLYLRDPFDRILITQALEEDLIIITKDREFSR
ncbi:MAG: type II toxin-antitoxin system VapC family toxin [Cytophagales bacterium]